MRIVAHRDRFTKMAAVNLLYEVGARNEHPSRTGFAHLFEHLMFRGTKRISNYDKPVQEACGENNAFTNSDYTDYYLTLPIDNLETALWLESDRMMGLNITATKLKAEKNVVIEEFNQRYLNQPYGDQWHLLREAAYRISPYRFPTIGATTEHIREATLDDVRAFYGRYYVPSNAILAIAGDIETERVFELSEKWFATLPTLPKPEDTIPTEPPITEPRRVEVTRNVPLNQITIAFQMADRLSSEYYTADMMSDLLAGGTSARLYRRLVVERGIFSSVNAYITGDIGQGLFIVTGQLFDNHSVAEGETALWEELEKLKSEPVSEYELQKVKNKFEANTLFGELNVMNKALNLCYYSMLGDTALVNRELDIYRSITKEQISAEATKMFRPEESVTILILNSNF